MWDRRMGNGKFGNLGLIPSDLGDQSGSRQALVKAKCRIFYCPGLLVESPSAEEGNRLSMAPSPLPLQREDGPILYLVVLWRNLLLKRIKWKSGVHLKESAFSGNLKESVLKEKHLSLEHLQLLDDKKHKYTMNWFFSCKLWCCLIGLISVSLETPTKWVSEDDGNYKFPLNFGLPLSVLWYTCVIHKQNFKSERATVLNLSS